MTARRHSELQTPNSKLVFLHGWATNSNVWHYQAKEFSKDYEVITIDLPGHCGKSTWDEPTLEPAIDMVKSHIPHPTSHIIVGIGWSLGAMVLMQMAYLNPGLFKGLILIGATSKFVAHKTFPWGQPLAVAKRMLKDIKKNFNKTTERFYPLNFTEEELANREAKEFIEFYQSKSKKFSQESIITALEALLSVDLREAISDINIPVLLIQGEKDNVCPVKAGQCLSENLPNAKLKVFKETGHAPFLTRAKAFNAIVQGFLERTVCART
ncbi:MAG: alpha/beta fold hydrolase [Deltaproteobacteria bacterium]|nr:alpha/beta fold hydrolase [Deltaproteobacteria bacterium]